MLRHPLDETRLLPDEFAVALLSGVEVEGSEAAVRRHEKPFRDEPPEPFTVPELGVGPPHPFPSQDGKDRVFGGLDVYP